MKICGKCKCEKNESDFTDSQLKNSYSVCKECLKKYRKDYYQKNKDELNRKQKLRYQKNKEYYMERNKEYRKNNAEKVSQMNKVYKEKTNYNSKYYYDNKEVLRQKKRDYIKNRYKHDVKYRLRILISRAVNISLKSISSSKQGMSIVNCLPYTLETLKEHIEKQFEEWMTWDNHGKYNLSTWDDNDRSTWTWQIDHIIPQSTFKYTSMEDEEFKQCWSLDNLRPLSSKQNLERSKKV